MTKKIKIQFTLNVLDDRILSDDIDVSVDFDRKEIRTPWELLFINYLKQLIGGHAQPLVFTAVNLATLKVKNIQHQDCDS